jgi:hypothetical protein
MLVEFGLFGDGVYFENEKVLKIEHYSFCS